MLRAIYRYLYALSGGLAWFDISGWACNRINECLPNETLSVGRESLLDRLISNSHFLAYHTGREAETQLCGTEGITLQFSLASLC